MKLSLELSKRLNELGVKVESEYVWMIPNMDMKGLTWELKRADDFTDSKLFCTIPAPTFEGLWAMLPAWIKNPKFGIGQYDLWLGKNQKGDKTFICYEVLFGNREKGGILAGSEHGHKSPTEAAGMLLIWAAENGHLEVE